MVWKKEISEIIKLREQARRRASGGSAARDRLETLVDAGSFEDVGILVGEMDGEKYHPVNLVVGTAKIQGTACVVASDDFRVAGGTYSVTSLKKSAYAEELAIKRKMPLIRFLEGGGARISGSQAQKGRSGYDFTSPPYLNVLAMQAFQSVPVVCAALGPCAGFSAVRLVASHFSIMTKDNACVFAGGPALVRDALNIEVSKDELGGAQVHGKSGVVFNIADDEQDACEQIQRFLSYMPKNVWQLPPVIESLDRDDRELPELDDLIPRNTKMTYKIRTAIEAIVDIGSYFELGSQHAPGQVTGLARISGKPVGILASDCTWQAGSMTADGSRKMRRFIETCDAFNLPIVSLIDEPGFAIGPQAETEATVRAGMETMFTVLQTKVPWLAIILRRAMGVAQGIHIGPNCEVYAWPSAVAGAMPIESGARLSFRKEIANAKNPVEYEKKLIEDLTRDQGMLPRAMDFSVHDLIAPRETRQVVCRWINTVWDQLDEIVGPKSHGIRP